MVEEEVVATYQCQQQFAGFCWYLLIFSLPSWPFDPWSSQWPFPWSCTRLFFMWTCARAGLGGTSRFPNFSSEVCSPWHVLTLLGIGSVLRPGTAETARRNSAMKSEMATKDLDAAPGAAGGDSSPALSEPRALRSTGWHRDLGIGPYRRMMQDDAGCTWNTWTFGAFGSLLSSEILLNLSLFSCFIARNHGRLNEAQWGANMHVTAAEKVEQLPKTSILCRCKLGLVHQEQLSCFANQSQDGRVKKNERKKQDILQCYKTSTSRRRQHVSAAAALCFYTGPVTGPWSIQSAPRKS